MAFFLTYLFPIIISIRTVNGTESGAVLSIFARIFFPLQGFFNFAVFIYPKVIHNKEKDVTWYTAFVKALKSRGLRKKLGEGSLQSSNNGRMSMRMSLSIKMVRSNNIFAVFGRFLGKLRNKLKGIQEKQNQGLAFNDNNDVTNADAPGPLRGNGISLAHGRWADMNDHVNNSVEHDGVNTVDVESGTFKKSVRFPISLDNCIDDDTCANDERFYYRVNGETEEDGGEEMSQLEEFDVKNEEEMEQNREQTVILEEFDVKNEEEVEQNGGEKADMLEECDVKSKE
jgi:hypothetical protein